MMAKKVATKVVRIARGTALALGAALMLALVLGIATTALAGTGAGATFNLGQTNTVNVISKLAGSVGGPSLQIDNNSTNSAATALDLQVEAGKAPMKVNSEVKVANLNSDKLDNLDSRAFVSSTYSKQASTTGDLGADGLRFEFLLCDGDDVALSGGYSSVDAGTVVSSSGPRFIGDNPDGWAVRWKNDATADTINMLVLCADVGTPRQ